MNSELSAHFDELSRRAVREKEKARGELFGEVVQEVLQVNVGAYICFGCDGCRFDAENQLAHCGVDGCWETSIVDVLSSKRGFEELVKFSMNKPFIDVYRKSVLCDNDRLRDYRHHNSALLGLIRQLSDSDWMETQRVSLLNKLEKEELAEREVGKSTQLHASELASLVALRQAYADLPPLDTWSATARHTPAPSPTLSIPFANSPYLPPAVSTPQKESAEGVQKEEVAERKARKRMQLGAPYSPTDAMSGATDITTSADGWTATATPSPVPSTQNGFNPKNDPSPVNGPSLRNGPSPKKTMESSPEIVIGTPKRAIPQGFKQEPPRIEKKPTLNRRLVYENQKVENDGERYYPNNSGFADIKEEPNSDDEGSINMGDADEPQVLEQRSDRRTLAPINKRRSIQLSDGGVGRGDSSWYTRGNGSARGGHARAATRGGYGHGIGRQANGDFEDFDNGGLQWINNSGDGRPHNACGQSSRAYSSGRGGQLGASGRKKKLVEVKEFLKTNQRLDSNSISMVYGDAFATPVTDQKGNIFTFKTQIQTEGENKGPTLVLGHYVEDLTKNPGSSNSWFRYKQAPGAFKLILGFDEAAFLLDRDIDKTPIMQSMKMLQQVWDRAL